MKPNTITTGGCKTLIAKCEWVSRQTFAAKTGRVPLRNGRIIPVWLAYRCLFCGEYFGQGGAEEHFGKKRSEYRESGEKFVEIDSILLKG
jgi:hypothetical protein